MSGSKVFKGFPLRDFVHPQGFHLDHILRTTSLRAEVERHIKGFAFSKAAKDKCGCPPADQSVRPPVANPYAGTVATDGKTSQSFQDQLEKFLDGLYLGCFESSVVQADARRPPQSYIYDIGFNTDKPTGFIVANPFDTLVTFGPRGPQSPYNVVDPGVVRMPKMPNVRVTPMPPDPKEPKKPRGSHNKAFVTTFGAAIGRPDKGDSPPRASIICDLNIRIVKNQRQELQALSLYGDSLKIHLSKGLVQPVALSASNEWVKTGGRLGIGVGTRVITFRRNRLPTWGGPIDLGGATVSITSSNLNARLRRINLGGTVAKPLIVFEDVEILA